MRLTSCPTKSESESEYLESSCCRHISKAAMNHIRLEMKNCNDLGIPTLCIQYVLQQV